MEDPTEEELPFSDTDSEKESLSEDKEEFKREKKDDQEENEIEEELLLVDADSEKERLSGDEEEFKSKNGKEDDEEEKEGETEENLQILQTDCEKASFDHIKNTEKKKIEILSEEKVSNETNRGEEEKEIAPEYMMTISDTDSDKGGKDFEHTKINDKEEKEKKNEEDVSLADIRMDKGRLSEDEEEFIRKEEDDEEVKETGKEEQMSTASTESDNDRSTLPEEARKAADLLENYKKCLENGKASEGELTRKQIVLIIEKDFDQNGIEVCGFADDLLEAKRYLESIAMYSASASVYEKEGGKVGLEGMGICVNRMRCCVSELRSVSRDVVSDNDNIDQEVEQHVISLMRDIKRGMEKVTSVDEETKCKEVIEVLLWIGKSELNIYELDAAEKTHKKRVGRVVDTFGNEAKKHKIYSKALKDLGFLYNDEMLQLEDATIFLKQAIEAYKAATDIDDRKREKCIENCEDKLREISCETQM